MTSEILVDTVMVEKVTFVERKNNGQGNYQQNQNKPQANNDPFVGSSIDINSDSLPF